MRTAPPIARRSRRDQKTQAPEPAPTQPQEILPKGAMLTDGGYVVNHPEFAERLRNAMDAKGLSNSDVARVVWGTTTDNRGYEVARNRDRIGAYLGGNVFPTKDTLDKLSEAVGVSFDDMKGRDVRQTQDRRPARTLHMMSASVPAPVPVPSEQLVWHQHYVTHPRRAVSIYVNGLVPSEIAQQIGNLLHEAQRRLQEEQEAANEQHQQRRERDGTAGAADTD